MPIWAGNVICVVVGLLLGAVIGFFISKKVTEKYLKENPPINEDMIKVLMSQMGRKPSQKQINQIMKEMNKFK